MQEPAIAGVPDNMLMLLAEKAEGYGVQYGMGIGARWPFLSYFASASKSVECQCRMLNVHNSLKNV
jgi:hypothetical protein